MYLFYMISLNKNLLIGLIINKAHVLGLYLGLVMMFFLVVK